VPGTTKKCLAAPPSLASSSWRPGGVQLVRATTTCSWMALTHLGVHAHINRIPHTVNYAHCERTVNHAHRARTPHTHTARSAETLALVLQAVWGYLVPTYLTLRFKLLAPSPNLLPLPHPPTPNPTPLPSAQTPKPHLPTPKSFRPSYPANLQPSTLNPAPCTQSPGP